MIKTLFGLVKTQGVPGVGTGPRTYKCWCGRSMIRAAEIIQRHELVHGHYVTIPTAYRMATDESKLPF